MALVVGGLPLGSSMPPNSNRAERISVMPMMPK